MAGLRIKTVASRTGLSPERLRAWERRHGVVTPVRSSGGYREYSEDDVHRLTLLQQLTGRGYTIGEVAPLDVGELEELADREDRPGPVREKPTARPRRPRRHEPLIGAALELDVRAVGRVLRRTLALSGGAEAVQRVLLPALAELAGRSQPATELALDLLVGEVRGLLGTLAADLPVTAPLTLVTWSGSSAPRRRLLEASLASLAAGRHVVRHGPAGVDLRDIAGQLGADTIVLLGDRDSGAPVRWLAPPSLLLWPDHHRGRSPQAPGLPPVVFSGIDLLSAFHSVDQDCG